MNKTIIMILRSIDINRGGVTKATIKRANLFAENYKQVIILTTLFQQNHLDTLKKLYEKELSSKVKVYNFFEYHKETSPKTFFKRKKKIKIKQKKYVAFRISHHEDYSYRYYQNGLYLKYSRFDEDRRIVFTDIRKDGMARTKRKEYDKQGNIVRIRHIDLKTNKPNFDQYYNRNRHCYLSVHLNPETNEDWSVLLFNQENKRYKNLREAQSEWLQTIIKKQKNPVLVAEQRQFDRDVVYSSKNVKKVIMVHSNHLLKPFNDYKKIDTPYIRLFNWLDKVDRLVLLTEEQKNDIEKVVGKTEKIEVIPHAYNKPNSIDRKKIIRKPLKVVVVARYVTDKRLDDIINAFEKVVKIIPEATLDIYGTGPLKQELNKMVKKLNLQNSIKLKGYTENPHEKYQEAACSLIISQREGFGMVITESLSVGTPVIAYDFKYGPKDIIRDNENGFIVENGNIEKLSKAIEKILSNPELQKRMSEKSKEIKKEFSEKEYENAWLNLINKI